MADLSVEVHVKQVQAAQRAYVSHTTASLCSRKKSREYPHARWGCQP